MRGILEPEMKNTELALNAASEKLEIFSNLSIRTNGTRDLYCALPSFIASLCWAGYIFAYKKTGATLVDSLRSSRWTDGCKINGRSHGICPFCMRTFYYYFLGSLQHIGRGHVLPFGSAFLQAHVCSARQKLLQNLYYDYLWWSCE